MRNSTVTWWKCSNVGDALPACDTGQRIMKPVYETTRDATEEGQVTSFAKKEKC
jgi:hypothetical protein